MGRTGSPEYLRGPYFASENPVRGYKRPFSVFGGLQNDTRVALHTNQRSRKITSSYRARNMRPGDDSSRLGHIVRSGQSAPNAPKVRRTGSLRRFTPAQRRRRYLPPATGHFRSVAV